MRTALLLVACLALLAQLLVGPVVLPQSVAAAPRPAAVPEPAPPPTVPEPDRDRVLGAGWRSTTDLAWTTSGDVNGLHLLVARASDGYTWRTAATLFEPGFETDRWIGNVCLTGSGQRAVVVYAPRQFTNDEELFQRGAFTAVVDLTSGSVHKLNLLTSLAYHNPGCGTGETAVLNQSGGQEFGRTRLHVLDTATGTTGKPYELPGQVTSAVPVADRIVAAGGRGLIELDHTGATRELATTRGAPSYLRADADGGVAFLEVHDERTAVAKYLTAGRTRELARGPRTELGITAGRGGQVFLTGEPSRVEALPRSVHRVNAPVRAELSTDGRLAVTHAGPGAAGPVTLTGKVTSTGASPKFGVLPGAPVTSEAPVGTTATGSPTDPVEAERTCAVARNDAKLQVIQPHWRQVEWAANLAVQGALTVQRPRNWRNYGLPAWTPQGLLPPLSLKGGGRVPAQIMLGILAQESNMWQASSHAIEGVAGNPLVGDYYGRRKSGDGWSVRFDVADCGYGVAQVTTGMRAGDQPINTQKAIAMDYATNIAAGLRILQDKWNTTYDHIKINNADPAALENWFAALWAYNTGLQPRDSAYGNPSGCIPSPTCTDANGMWGLGWANNPINPDYPATRAPFLEESQDDARTPNLWPYPEKVIGWAAYPITKTDFRQDDFYEGGYRQAWWSSADDRTLAKPPISLFCNASNSCDRGRAQPCQRVDFRCWWHEPAEWKDCEYNCGNENMRFSPEDPEPQFGSGGLQTEHYRPNCDPYSNAENGANGVPRNSLIIDDVPGTAPTIRPNCVRNWENKGTFALNFAADHEGRYRSKIDFHQIGAGMGGHFWFAHTHQQNSNMRVTGTWTLGQELHSWARVLVHIPDHGAHTQQAAYAIDLGDGRTRHRVALQRLESNTWVSLGVFDFNGTPKVSLSNITQDGSWTEDIAWDAIAFQPLARKPRNIVVSLGDSYSSGEGAVDDFDDYYLESDSNGGRVVGTYRDPGYTWLYGNACHRSRYAWPRMATAGDNLDESLGSRHDRWDADVDLQLHACSGAQTENILPAASPYPDETNSFGDANHGQYRELAQLDKGYLDENTTLVTFSVGGNDARFAAVITECLLNVVNHCPEATLDGDAGTLRQVEPAVITDKVKPSIKTVLRAIHRRAPNATIVLMGYPILFENDGECFPGIDAFVEGTWLTEMGYHLSNEMGAAAAEVAAETGARVVFANPIPYFVNKAVCASNPAINNIVYTRSPGEVEIPLQSQQSFHPNRDGTRFYGYALDATLRELGL